MDIINNKKKRNQPMPYQCEICGSCTAVKKDERNTEKAENNKCFEKRTLPDGTPYNYFYRPFTNSKREINATCKNFSHLRTLKAW
jgi:hypothetical protein